MRVTDVSKSVAPRSVSDAKALSQGELRGLFSGFDLGFFPTRSELCSLLGRAANALAALFGDDEPASTPGGGMKAKATSGSGMDSIVDFGDGKHGKGNKSIVDFGDRPASIVDFGDGKTPTE